MCAIAIPTVQPARWAAEQHCMKRAPYPPTCILQLGCAGHLGIKKQHKPQQVEAQLPQVHLHRQQAAESWTLWSVLGQSQRAFMRRAAIWFVQLSGHTAVLCVCSIPLPAAAYAVDASTTTFHALFVFALLPGVHFFTSHVHLEPQQPRTSPSPTCTGNSKVSP